MNACLPTVLAMQLVIMSLVDTDAFVTEVIRVMDSSIVSVSVTNTINLQTSLSNIPFLCGCLTLDALKQKLLK